MTVKSDTAWKLSEKGCENGCRKVSGMIRKMSECPISGGQVSDIGHSDFANCLNFNIFIFWHGIGTGNQ